VKRRMHCRKAGYNWRTRFYRNEMDCTEIKFTRHAMERMFQRSISPETIHMIIENSEMIMSYPDDTPHPSVLLLGFDSGRPVHIVIALEAASGLCHVITVYQPDADVWDDDFKMRRK